MDSYWTKIRQDSQYQQEEVLACQTQAPKKDKRGRWEDHGNHPATGVNATKVVKKDKDKAPKDLTYVKCYTYHQKDYYAKKCPEN